MRQIYRKIDKLEAFVKMIGNSVAGLEERVAKAETDFGAFPSTFKKILHTISIPSFLNKSSSSRQQQTLYEPPVLFKTEDYFPCLNEAPYWWFLPWDWYESARIERAKWTKGMPTSEELHFSKHYWWHIAILILIVFLQAIFSGNLCLCTLFQKPS